MPPTKEEEKVVTSKEDQRKRKPSESVTQPKSNFSQTGSHTSKSVYQPTKHPKKVP
jgi:hypothetical protein